MTTATLGDGLEEIGERAYCKCTSMHRIVVPNAVKTIKGSAFNGCLRMMTVILCDGLESALKLKRFFPARRCVIGGIRDFI